jgi:putative membrane-bound dehydrogenase-like protein
MSEYFYAIRTFLAIPLIFVLAAAGILTHTDQLSADETGIRVPAGFRVELYADDDLAHDIHSLTIDSFGRVTVSGPGYVRILIDADEDGRAETFKQFVDRPKTGAQGMFWLGRSLMCSGDDGLQIFRDDNRDDVADGPPEVFLKIAAGGEHHVHSIQRGPDGWWYVIAGNFAGVTGAYATLPTSPLKKPINGVLMRLKPDLSGGEIISDGMRNAYDFAFSASGDVFTYDSDDERDISLPWYQPTRAFHLLPLSQAGWVSDGWKRPGRFADMPPVIGSFGRGSPTGVVCYQHEQFPAKYHNALFILDWTLGRIHALPLQKNGAGWTSEPEEFAAGQNQFGFAPTDLEVGPDGSLFISVGGRGTRGSVYRIYHEEGRRTLKSPPDPLSDEDRLQRVLTAWQPLSSWSRASWMATARKLGADVFRGAAVDDTLPEAQRVRAIELLVDMFEGLALPLAERLAESESPAVRARTAWAVGRTQPDTPDIPLLQRLMSDTDPAVVRASLEALICITDDSQLQPLLPQLVACLGHESREVRLTAAQIVSRSSNTLQQQLIPLTEGHARARLWLYLGIQQRSSAVSMDAARAAVDVITDEQAAVELKRDAVRTLQLALGDVGPATGRPAVLHGYGSRVSLDSVDAELNPVRSGLAEIFPTGDAEVDYELIRVFAMTTQLNRELLSRILKTITPESLPADDIHRLIALSQFDLERSIEETTAVAKALVNIDIKIRRLDMRQDTNWDDRIGELYTALIQVDPALPELIPEQPGFGQPAHTIFMSKVPQTAVAKAIESFVATITADPEYSWSNDVVFLIGESEKPEHRLLLREQLENLSVRDAVLIVLSEKPVKEDRSLYVDGLDSPQLNAVDACIKALTALPRSNDPAEQYRLLSVARRLVNDEREFKIRETVMRLLQNNTGLDEGFVFGADGYRPQPDRMQQWQQALAAKYPMYRPAAETDQAQRVLSLLAEVNWENGDATRGKKLFEKISCARCHGGRRALGPDLTGVAKRFSREDLFAAIVDPNRDISARYQTTAVTTKSGKVYSGLIVYESVDGMLLRDAEHKTYRIEGHDIESRHLQRVSLMPAGLLKDVDAAGLADLNAWLQSL